jgi:hypothetical protein
MKAVQLKGQPNPINLTEVVRDDDQAVIGTTNSGKRFVTRVENIGAPIPPRHPYRVYLMNGMAIRAIDPSFEELEEWYLGDSEGPLAVTLADHSTAQLERANVRSLLSATPEDQEQAEANVGAESADED